MAVKRTCVCCGKNYEYCPGCHRKDQPAWMATFCSEPCKELFNIISAYNVKRISKDVVKNYLSEHNVDSEKYVGPVRKVIEEVMKEDVKPVSSLSKALSQTETKPDIRKVEETKKVVLPDRPNRNASSLTNESRSKRKRKRNRQVDIDLN